MGIEVVPTLKRLRKGTTPGSSRPESDAHGHGRKNPQRQVAIQKTEA